MREEGWVANPEDEHREGGLTRREVVRDGSLLAIAVLAAGPASAFGDVAVAVRQGTPAFLSPAELKALRGLVDRFIPGPPEDPDDGALAAGCAEAIDALLGSFLSDPPRIWAGAPFSDRAGSDVNHFTRFLSLDSYEEKAWRLRIEGSGGRPELEFNGRVKGWQEIYRAGLTALDAAAGPVPFGDQPGPARDLVLQNSGGNPDVAAMVDIAFPHTYQFMYGAPEYGGNRDLVGWRYTNYDGDVLPRGWTRAEIEEPGSGARRANLDEAPLPLERLIALSPLGASPEAAHGMLTRSDGTLSGLREQLDPVAAAIDAAIEERERDGA
jgi:hypothetical protein